MKKPNSLTELFTILSGPQDAPASPDQFLYLLGTDCKFLSQPTPVKTKSDRGDTLSYSAQVAVTLLGETATSGTDLSGCSSLSYCSPSVDVIDGPTTLGVEVHERIAQGVFLALRAAATGKTTLQLSAFSRGAAEAILVIHEIDRIKKALTETPDKPLKDILSESPDTFMRGVITKLFTDAATGETRQLRATLLERLNALKINAFLIDPVPGDTTYGLPGIGWHDDRFYHKLPCDNYELILQRDERTTCFYPVRPLGIKPTVLPGHHGSSSGNQYDQQGAFPAAGELATKDRTAVQDLALLKLLYFWQQNISAFGESRTDELSLNHTDLDVVANRFLRATPADRKKQMLALYQKIHLNDDAYKYFRDTSFPVLGRRVTSTGGRYFHDQSASYSDMSTIAPMTTGPIVNTEHARLFLSENFHFEDLHDAGVTTQVSQITKTLEDMIGQARLEKSSTTEAKSELMSIVSSTHDGKALFSAGLSMLVDSISTKYLSNTLSVQEKIDLMAVLDLPFKHLAEATASGVDLKAEHLAFFKDCLTSLQTALKSTVETHYKTTVQKYEDLYQQVELILEKDNDFSEKFTTYRDSFNWETPLINDSDKNYTLIIKDKFRAIDPITVENTEKAFSDIIQMITEDGELGQEKQAALISEIFNEKYVILRPYFEAHQKSVDDYLSQMSQLYDATLELDALYPQLQRLVGNTEPALIKRSQIFSYTSALTTMAGKLLKEKGYDLGTDQSEINQGFYQQAKAHAISLGAVSPDITRLDAKIASLESTITENDRQHEAQMARSDGDSRAVIEALEAEKASVIAEKQALNDALAQQKQLATPAEMRAQHIINKELLPITEKYLTHLLTEAAKYSTSKIDTTNPRQVLEDQPDGTKNPVAYNAIKEKVVKVQALLDSLITESIFLPTDRLKNFHTELNRTKTTITKHRDSAWIGFIKACATVLSVLATGILPGVISLAVSQKNSPFFFGQSKGEQFSNEADKLSQSNPPGTTHQG